MTPQAKIIIKKVADERGVDVAMILSRCRVQSVFRARIEIAKRLSEAGYSANKIGKFLNHDHTTILFYLGRHSVKKPSAERPPKPPRKRAWKPPRVRHLIWIRRQRHFLIPYAGADMTDYQWKERPRHEHPSH